MDSRKQFGEAAEDAAASFIKSLGYRILARNFSTHHGEIDIIAADGETVCFVEVKARQTADFAPPESAVNLKKQSHIRKAATAFLAMNNLQIRICRFDVLAMIPAPDKKSWKIEHIRDAF